MKGELVNGAAGWRGTASGTPPPLGMRTTRFDAPAGLWALMAEWWDFYFEFNYNSF